MVWYVWWEGWLDWFTRVILAWIEAAFLLIVHGHLFIGTRSIWHNRK
jgi:hypothetical protein